MTKLKSLIPLPRIREDDDRILYGDAVMQSVRQLKALLESDPEMTVATVAERMAMSKKDTTKMLKLLGRQR